MYDNIPAKVLQAVYPAHSWKFWHFEPIPRGFWDDQKGHRLFADWLGAELGFKKWEDWYVLQVRDFTQRKASGLLTRYNNSPLELLTKVSILPPLLFPLLLTRCILLWWMVLQFVPLVGFLGF